MSSIPLLFASAVLLVSTTTTHADQSFEDFRIATFQEDITIPLGHRCMGILPTRATEIVDPLEARGFVLLGPDDPIVFVALDWCEVRNQSYDDWRRRIALTVETSMDRVLVCALHQHDAPVIDAGAQALLDDVGLKDALFDSEFHEDCLSRVCEAIRTSLESAQPVTHIGVGQAPVERIASNRRVVEPDNRVTFARGSASGGNAHYAAAPAGVIDPLLRTISFWNDEVPVVALHCYATHPMSYYGRGGVSADFVGMARRWRQDDDPHVFQIYASGCSGDVTAGKFNDGSPANRPELARRLHKAMREAWESTQRHPLEAIEFRCTKLDLDFIDDDRFTEEALVATLNDEDIAERERILAAMGLNSLRRQNAGHTIDFPCVDLGPARLLLFPGETFVAFQRMAQEMNPASMVMSIGYGDGWTGYVPTETALSEGFETSWRWVGTGSESVLLEAMSQLLRNSSGGASDWPQFRGQNSAGVSTGAPPPVEFGPGKNERWRLELPSGHSSPCIVGERLFVTGFDTSTETLELLCIDRLQGEIIWRRTLETESIETGHPSFNPASSTPACNGRYVIAYFGSYGLACFDMDGELQWDVRMPLAKSYGGNATSPTIAGDRVFLYRGNYVDHYLLAIDLNSGDELWRVLQEEPFTTDMACTATPVVHDDQLILHGARTVQSYSIESGELLWRVNCSTTGTSTPVIAKHEVLVTTWNQTGEASLTPTLPSFEDLVDEEDANGNRQIEQDEFPRLMIFHRSDGTDAPHNGAPIRFSYIDTDRDGAIDRGEWREWQRKDASRREEYVPHGLIAIELDRRGLLDQTDIRRLADDSIPEVPSPVVQDNYVYYVKNGGIMTCVDITSGEQILRIRTEGTGTHYASPIIAGDKLYSTAGNGTISVLTLGPDAEVLAVNDMGEEVYATPAVVDGILYVRTHSALFAFEYQE